MAGDSFHAAWPDAVGAPRLCARVVSVPNAFNAVMLRWQVHRSSMHVTEACLPDSGLSLDCLF